MQNHCSKCFIELDNDEIGFNLGLCRDCLNEKDVKNQDKKEPKEMVNSPSHYNSGKIEVIDFIEDQNLDFNLGNVIKYTARAAHKGTKIQDLHKARWYINRAISRLENK